MYQGFTSYLNSLHALYAQQHMLNVNRREILYMTDSLYRWHY